MAGVRVARRAASSLQDGRQEITGIAAEIAEDLDTLEQLMQRLQVGRSRIKDVTGVVAERLSRLKPNGRLTGRSPLSDLLELETLVAGITGKKALWVSLRGVPHVSSDEMDQLVERAESQKRRVEAMRVAAARRCFGESR